MSVFDQIKDLIFKQNDSAAGGITNILAVNGIGILSAICCNQLAANSDQQLGENLECALKQLGLNIPVHLETITSAQGQIRRMSSELDSEQKQLIDTVMTLFQGQGLGIFPMLIVNRKIAFYGGVPTIEMLVKRLPELLSAEVAREGQ